MELLLYLSSPVFLILFVQCVCRLSRGDTTVIKKVRFGYVLIAMASVYCFIAPIIFNSPLHWPEVLLATAMVLRQWATADMWSNGIPIHVLKRKRG